MIMKMPYSLLFPSYLLFSLKPSHLVPVVHIVCEAECLHISSRVISLAAMHVRSVNPSVRTGTGKHIFFSYVRVSQGQSQGEADFVIVP